MTQLSRLHSIIHRLNTDIGHLENPLNRFDDLLSQIDGTLHIPKQIAEDIKTIRTDLTYVFDVADLGSAVPIIGTACGGVSRVLKPLVKRPKPNGALGKAEGILRDIDKDVLKGLKALVSQMKSPVDKTRHSVNSIHADVIAIELQLQNLIEKYGDKVPKEIEKCAKDIADVIEQPVRILDDSNDYVKDALGTLEGALRPVQTILGTIEGIANTFHGILQKVSNKSLNNFLKDLDRFVNKVKGKGKLAVKAAAAWAHIDLDKIERKMDSLENQISGFFTKAIDNEMSHLRDNLQSAIGQIPGVDKLEKSVGDAKEAFAKLEAEIEKLMGSACAKTLEF